MKIDLKKIERLAASNNVDLVVLYGSQLTNYVNARSDIDIAVHVKTAKIEYPAFSKMLGDFVGIFGDKLDLVLLNEAPPLLKYQIAVYGKVLYEEKEGLFDSFKILSSRFYADTKKFRDLNSVYIDNFLKGVIPIGR
ncbi:MAG: nucleotidyltransferase domain-containing protein [Candidatus Margulisbacteria bacterium]|nr:nucleotidyltransferase domain-containing protein [Candidatus Margulisiibacteriota bacterium]